MRRQRLRTDARALATCAMLAVVGISVVGCGSSGVRRPRLARKGVAAYRASAPAPPAPPRFFAATSFWNAPLAPTAPRLPDSDQLRASLEAMVREEVARKFGPWISSRGFSTPIYTVGADQQAVVVHLDNTEPALARAFARVPLPDDAKPADGTDGQLTVWQPSSDRLWEFWRLRHQSDGWHAQWGGAMEHTSQNAGLFSSESWPGATSHWGATSTSLPLVGGLITLADLEQKRIDHALALGLPKISRGVVRWPAQRTDGVFEGQEGIPAGTRFRLDPNLDLARLSLPPLVAMIAEAAQRYGLVVRDTSTIVDFYAEDPTRTGTNPLRAYFTEEPPWQQLEQFPWSHLEALAPPAH